MSSGLEIKESSIRKDWVGQRLWINLQSLGFQSINFDLPGNSKSVEKEPDAKHTEYKSDWLKHMSLQSDLESEREGVVVRSIPGLAGVDYLTPGALTNHVSYVFGPVIKALVTAGYTEGLNLDAMSYDWRLSPAGASGIMVCLLCTCICMHLLIFSFSGRCSFGGARSVFHSNYSTRGAYVQ